METMIRAAWRRLMVDSGHAIELRYGARWPIAVTRSGFGQ
jgi:hypothetical protein